jgi:hypothetical protein
VPGEFCGDVVVVRVGAGVEGRPGDTDLGHVLAEHGDRVQRVGFHDIETVGAAADELSAGQRPRWTLVDAAWTPDAAAAATLDNETIS